MKNAGIFLKCTTLTVALSPFVVGAAAQGGTVAEGQVRDVSRTPDQCAHAWANDAYCGFLAVRVTPHRNRAFNPALR